MSNYTRTLRHSMAGKQMQAGQRMRPPCMPCKHARQRTTSGEAAVTVMLSVRSLLAVTARVGVPGGPIRTSPDAPLTTELPASASLPAWMVNL